MPIFEKLDFESPFDWRLLMDANGQIVGDIFDEYYGLWMDISLSESNVVMRYQDDWSANMSSDVYFVGDSCSPESAYAHGGAIPQVGPGRGFIVRREQNHIYEMIPLFEDVVVGSKLSGGACEDIIDEQLNLIILKWHGIDEFVRPLTRHGPPPCSIAPISGCY